GVAVVGHGDLGTTVDGLDLDADLLDAPGVATHVGDRLLDYPVHRRGNGRGDHGLVDLDLERHPGAGSLVEQVAQVLNPGHGSQRGPVTTERVDEPPHRGHGGGAAALDVL